MWMQSGCNLNAVWMQSGCNLDEIWMQSSSGSSGAILSFSVYFTKQIYLTFFFFHLEHSLQYFQTRTDCKQAKIDLILSCFFRCYFPQVSSYHYTRGKRMLFISANYP